MSFSDGLPFFNDGDAVASTSTLPQEASTSSTPSSNKAAKGKKRARDGQSNGTNTSNGDNNIEASLAYIPHKDTALPDFTEAFWKQQFHIAETVQEDFKTPELPLARVKRVMKTSPEVAMIASEVPVILEKAIQIFISDLTARAYIASSKRRTLTKSDVARATKQSDLFDFLIDVVVPPEPETGTTKRGSHKKQQSNHTNGSGDGSNEVNEGADQPLHSPKLEEEDDFDMNGLLAGSADQDPDERGGGGQVEVDEDAVNDHLLNFDEAIDVTLPDDFSQGIFGLVG